MGSTTMAKHEEFNAQAARERLEAEVEARKVKHAKPVQGERPDYQALAQILEKAGLGEHKPQDLAGAIVHLQHQKSEAQRREDARTAKRRGLTDTEREISRAVAGIFGGQGMFDLSPEEIEAADQQVKNSYKADAAQLAEERLEGRINAMIPSHFRGTFDIKKVKPNVNRAEVKKVTGWVYGPKGLYIYGESGRSKTWALYSLAERLMREGRSVVVLDGPSFSIEAGKAFSDPSKTEAWLRTMVAPQVLVIDDMGKRWTPATEDAAFTVLDRRTARDKPTLVSLNYTGEELAAMSAARGELSALRDIVTPLRRRLQDYCISAIF